MAVFVAVVENGSLAGAARRTGLTPSAVSKLVSRLERDFGAPLLRRTTRSMTVTDAGQTYYERARHVLEELRAVEREMSNKSREPRGVLRVSAPLLFGQTRVLPILLAFLADTPAVTLELDLTDRSVDMVAERIDLAVRITADPPWAFVARRAGSVRRVLCASPAYLRSHKAPRAPRDLQDHQCLTTTAHGLPDAWQLYSNPTSAPETVRITPRLRVNSTLALRDAATAGLGIADLPRYLIEEELAARKLVPVLDRFTTLESGVFVLYAAGPLLPKRVKEAAARLVRELPKGL